MYFRFFVIISPWERAGPFIWTNLNPLHQRMLCAKFGWNSPSGSGGEDFLISSIYFHYIVIQYLLITTCTPKFVATEPLLLPIRAKCTWMQISFHANLTSIRREDWYACILQFWKINIKKYFSYSLFNQLA